MRVIKECKISHGIASIDEDGSFGETNNIFRLLQLQQSHQNNQSTWVSISLNS
jgi:hypothetical protein